MANIEDMRRPHSFTASHPGDNSLQPHGDLGNFSLEQQIAIHAHWTQTHVDQTLINGIPEHVTFESARLREEITQFKEILKRPHYQTFLDATAASFITTDLLTLGQRPEEQAARRLEMFEGIEILSDMDGTMTSNTHEYIPHKIPGSYVAEAHMAQFGRETFPEIYAQVWQPSLRDDPNTYHEGGKTAQIREGVNEFLAYAKDIGADFSVLTANFDAFAKGVLTQIPNAPGTKVYAVTKDSILSTAKAEILDYVAVHNPNKALVFIGDGGSDLEALKARGVAVYFALEGGVFAKQLEAEGKLYFPYRTFRDIQVKLQEIRELKERTDQAA